MAVEMTCSTPTLKFVTYKVVPSAPTVMFLGKAFRPLVLTVLTTLAVAGFLTSRTATFVILGSLGVLFGVNRLEFATAKS